MAVRFSRGLCVRATTNAQGARGLTDCCRPGAADTEDSGRSPQTNAAGSCCCCGVRVFYLVGVVNDLQARADHLHQVEQEQRDGVDLQQRQTTRERERFNPVQSDPSGLSHFIIQLSLISPHMAWFIGYKTFNMSGIYYLLGCNVREMKRTDLLLAYWKPVKRGPSKNSKNRRLSIQLAGG